MSADEAQSNDTQPPVVWALRLTEGAREDLAAAWQHLAATAGEEVANDWSGGLYSALASLAEWPERTPVAAENPYFSQTVRKFIYRRTLRSVAYQIFFYLVTAPDDAPTLRVIHIRHATRAPLPRMEARQIEANE